MPTEVLTCDSRDVMETIDLYLTEDYKDSIFGKLKAKRVRSVHGGDRFLTHSIANKVKTFVEDGQYVAFIAYGIDYMLFEKPGSFSTQTFTCHEELTNVVHQICFEWHQDGGRIDEDTLDRIYAWLMISPYSAMSMTENVRHELHKAVDFFWVCTATGNRALATQCYDRGKDMTNRSIQQWMDNVLIMVKGCGYTNIIEPQEC